MDLVNPEPDPLCAKCQHPKSDHEAHLYENYPYIEQGFCTNEPVLSPLLSKIIRLKPGLCVKLGLSPNTNKVVCGCPHFVENTSDQEITEDLPF